MSKIDNNRDRDSASYDSLRLPRSLAKFIDWEGIRTSLAAVSTMSSQPEGQNNVRIRKAFGGVRDRLRPKIDHFRRVQYAFLWLAFGALLVAILGAFLSAFTPRVSTGLVMFAGSEAAFCAFFFNVLKYVRGADKIEHFLATYEIAFAACNTDEQQSFVLKQFIAGIGALQGE